MICITGACGGLGKAFAQECARRGWNLFLTDINSEGLICLADGLRRLYGIRVEQFSCDLSDSESRGLLFGHLIKNQLPFWGLINVAGIDYEGPFLERSPQQVTGILRLNLEANLDVTLNLLRLRAKDRSFMVINVASLAAFYPMPLKATYAASKRFLLDFSLALREELKDYGVTVTALCPAGMPTNENSISAINAQGFAGRITTKNVGPVAAGTIKRALKGRAVYVPGLFNTCIKIIGLFVPPRIIAWAIRERWSKAQCRNGRISRLEPPVLQS